MSQLLTIEYTCDKVVRWAIESLETAGLNVANSFDLQSARAPLSYCTFPHHGSADCDCQVMILLVYGIDGKPATLVVYGHDGQTSLSLVETPEQQPSPRLKESIEMALKPHAPVRPAISPAVIS